MMWNADQNYTKEELETVRELEYELFMADPGFRLMWHDDFEEYFKGTMNEEYWHKREEERHRELTEQTRRRMIEDPGYANWRSELAMAEDTVLQALSDPVLSRGRRFERANLDLDYERPDYESDPLYLAAKNWSRELSQKADELYEQTKFLPLFRIAKNAPYVASKIVFAAGNTHAEDEIDLEWRTDRVGYTLSLSCLNRCLDSLVELKDMDFADFQKQGNRMRQELIDRLEKIEQLRFKRLLSF